MDLGFQLLIVVYDTTLVITTVDILKIQKIYSTKKHSQARNVIERAWGKLK